MSTDLPKGKTICSLNKKEILQLPGFNHLKLYLCKELKQMVRERVSEQYKCNKRGFTVQNYLDKYNVKPEPYFPKYKTDRYSIRAAQRREATNNLLDKIKEKAKNSKAPTTPTKIKLEKVRTLPEEKEDVELEEEEKPIKLPPSRHSSPPPLPPSRHSSPPPLPPSRHSSPPPTPLHPPKKIFVSQLALDSLEPEKWVDDEAIDAYVKLINQSRPPSDTRKIGYIGPYFKKVLEGKEYTKINKFDIFEGKNIGIFDYFMFPYCYNNTHWILVIITPNEDKISIYDSQFDSTSSDNPRFTGIINLIKPFYRKNIGRTIQQTKMIVGPHQHEDNGYDCGIFVMEYAKRFLLNQPQNFTQEDTDKIRKHIQDTLRKYLRPGNTYSGNPYIKKKNLAKKVVEVKQPRVKKINKKAEHEQNTYDYFESHGWDNLAKAYMYSYWNIHDGEESGVPKLKSRRR